MVECLHAFWMLSLKWQILKLSLHAVNKYLFLMEKKVSALGVNHLEQDLFFFFFKFHIWFYQSYQSYNALILQSSFTPFDYVFIFVSCSK